MTIEEYLQNPMGKGSTVMMNSSIKNDLDSQYNLLYEKIKQRLYLIDDHNLVFYLQIPSRSVDGIYYDVIVEIDTNSAPTGVSTINKLPFKVFSNCPSFTYTYAHAFYKQGMLCPWAINRYESEVLNKDPIVRNKFEIISYERSLYIALKYITARGNGYIEKNKVLATKYKNYGNIYTKLQSQYEVENRYAILKKRKMIEKNKEKDEKINVPKNSGTSKKSSITTVKSVSHTKRTNKTKKTKRTGTK